MSVTITTQSSTSAKEGALRQARQYGMIAAYLNFTSITLALVIACLTIGLVVGIHGREYSIQACINKGKIPSTHVVLGNYCQACCDTTRMVDSTLEVPKPVE